MMETKERLILEVAIKLFSMKGYHDTSMQEIAEECGISKGSLYKAFASKEELFIDIFVYYHDSMFEKAKGISSNVTLPPKEKLMKQISLQVSDIIEKKDFILLFFKDVPIKDKEKIKPIMQRMKARILLWQKNLLLETFGSDIEPYSWDLVMSLQGMMKEFLFISFEIDHFYDSDHLAEQLINKIEAMIRHLQAEQPVPLLTDFMMEDFLKTEASTRLKEEKIAQSLEELRVKVQCTENQQFIDSLALIEAELNKDQPKLFLIEALLIYMEKESTLTFPAKKLTNLLFNR
ncbi:AcrR family transcriptional regulator [Bacillus ectoiniformans]|uniref:TetR/AcrR family transcriptional regulator n=1 Tax=Bacillus ectoiniformans TaxID=1494429 RepID=UPI001956CF98|nr:TetR/AcrR family transcriptional regulator [Bacillus ectoiniformans]MBM7648717.1 AcrR family transcriptional regulator [Bacillus ectoiniformans]